jgi:hypothetical protein
MLDLKYIQHIGRSVKENYKSWIVLFLSCTVICYNRTSILLGNAQYLFCILFSYLAHRLSHEPIGFFLNRAHIYHHEHTDWTSHAIQVCVELAASFSPMVILYYFMDLKDNVFLFDPYVFLLFSIFYTSVHNVNYGMFHVNQTHYKHHLDYAVNYGPDICDIVFNTKYPENDVENTDHYIPNILVATVLTYLFRHFYERTEHKGIVKEGLVKLYYGVCLVVGVFTTKKTIMDIQKNTVSEVKQFQHDVGKLMMKLGHTI